MTTVLLYSGLIFYLLNYIIGWMLLLKRITVSKRAHRVMFFLILIHLIALCVLMFIDTRIPVLILLTVSLICIATLPMFINNDKYHLYSSSIGLLLYIIVLVIIKD